MRTLLAATLALAAVASPARAAAPKYYVVVQPLEGAKDVPPALVEKLFLAEIAKHPEFAPQRQGLPADQKALAEELSKDHLKGYFVTVKILQSERTLTPPAPGKRGELSRHIKLSLVGATIPEQLVAFGGDGECTAAAEVGKHVTQSDEDGLLSDAIKDAVSQAVTTAVVKLTAADKPAPAHHKAKKK